METFFFYIVKSSLCLIIFYMFFKVLLSRETFFRLNRFVLLGGIIICNILPFIIFQTGKETSIQIPIRHIEKLLLTTTDNIDTPVIPMYLNNEIKNTESFQDTEQMALSNKSMLFSFSKTQIFCLAYGTGLLITMISLLVSVIRMIQLIHNGKKIDHSGFKLILTQQKICPFSFGRYIVISENDYFQNPNEILTHEQVHARKMHSFDLLFIEFFILLYWFNPVIWLLKREMQDIHEYEADNGVINQGIDATQYQLLLVKKAVGARSYAIANSFNHSKIKNRITMMLKRKSTQWARLKLILFVPLAAVVLQAFARPEIDQLQKTFDGNEGTNFILENRQATMDFLSNKRDSIVAKDKKRVTVNSSDDRTVLKMTDPEEVPMTKEEKAATNEFEAASRKFSYVMEKHAAEIEKKFNSKAMQDLTKEFEMAAKKFEKAMQDFQYSHKLDSEKMEIQSQEFEKAAEKFGKVMEEHASELENDIESPEVKAAKEEFKYASEKFKENMELMKADMKNVKETPELKEAKEEFKTAGEKYKQGMNELKINMKEIKEDQEMKAAKEEFKIATDKYKQVMEDYQKRVEVQRQTAK